MKATLIESRLCDQGMYDEAIRFQELLDIAWAAGIIEGEGSIICTKIKSRKDSYRVCISVTMSDKDVVEKLHKILSVGTVTFRKAQPSGNKDLWVWAVQNQAGCYSVALKIADHMGLRRSEAIKSMLAVIEERLVERD